MLCMCMQGCGNILLRLLSSNRRCHELNCKTVYTSAISNRLKYRFLNRCLNDFDLAQWIRMRLYLYPLDGILMFKKNG